MENNIVLNDISYGSHERQKLDIFIPKNPKCQCGIMLFIHGGGWIQGDKIGHIDDARHFCNLGYISATMNYRFVDENTTVYDELDDITAALKTIKNECRNYGFNIEKLILSGGSAGAHLSLLYAYTRMKEAPITPVAVCPYCPPVDCSKPDFLMGISGEFENWKYGVLSKCCGLETNRENLFKLQQQEALKKISPQEYISENCVPTAIFHGRHDELIPFSHIEKFISSLNEKSIKNDLIIYENSGHALDKDPETASKTKDIIKKYAEMYF
ncbi:MAG: alpha/beta hydrolase [Ruminococcaceae bacterium]|nr:alpha/beta hydrolase [Oscillospiraceae bacterium]